MAGNPIRIGIKGKFPLFLLLIPFFLPLIGVFLKMLPQEAGWNGQIWRILTNPSVQKTLGFTLKQAFFSALFSVLLALPGAALFSKYNFPFKKMVLSISTISFILPPILVVLAFVQFWGQQGWFNRFLMSLGLIEDPIRVLYSGKAIILAHVFYNIPLALRLITDGWSGIPLSQGRAAASLGAGPFRNFFKVQLPQILPYIAGSFLLIFLYCFLSFSIVLVLGGGPKFSTLEVEIYQQIKFNQAYLRGAVLALIEISIALTLIGLYFLFDRNLKRTQQNQEITQERKPYLTGKGYIFVTLYLLLFFTFLGGPLLAMVSESFLFSPTRSGPKELSLRWYASLFSSRAPWISIKSIFQSLKFAFLSTLLVTSFSLLIGHLLLRKKVMFQKLTEVLILLPMGISTVILSLGYLFLSVKLDNSYLSRSMIVFIHSFIALPFAYRSMSHRISQIPQSIMEAGSSLGAKPFQRLKGVEWPLLRQSLLTGALFAFAISMGEVNAVLILSPPGQSTIPLAIYRLIGNYNFGGASAMGSILLLLTLIIFLMMERLKKDD